MADGQQQGGGGGGAGGRPVLRNRITAPGAGKNLNCVIKCHI